MIKIMFISALLVCLLPCGRIYSQDNLDARSLLSKDSDATQVFDVKLFPGTHPSEQPDLPSFPITEYSFCRSDANPMPNSYPRVTTQLSESGSNIFAPAERVVICGWNFPSTFGIPVVITSPSGVVHELFAMVGEKPMWFFVPELSTTELGKYTISSKDGDSFEAIEFFVENSGPPMASVIDKKIMIDNDPITQQITSASVEVTVVASGFPFGREPRFLAFDEWLHEILPGFTGND